MNQNGLYPFCMKKNKIKKYIRVVGETACRGIYLHHMGQDKA